MVAPGVVEAGVLTFWVVATVAFVEGVNACVVLFACVAFVAFVAVMFAETVASKGMAFMKGSFIIKVKMASMFFEKSASVLSVILTVGLVKNAVMLSFAPIFALAF